MTETIGEIALTWDEVAAKVKDVLDKGFGQDFEVHWERTELVITVSLPIGGLSQAAFWRYKYTRNIDQFMHDVVEQVSSSMVNIPFDPPRDPATIDPHF